MTTRKRKTVRKSSRKIPARQGLQPIAKRYKYPFDDLKVEGNYFIVDTMALENSVRAQASKNQKARGVRYSVTRVHKGEKLSDGTLIKNDGLIVRFDGYQLPL